MLVFRGQSHGFPMVFLFNTKTFKFAQTRPREPSAPKVPLVSPVVKRADQPGGMVNRQYCGSSLVQQRSQTSNWQTREDI